MSLQTETNVDTTTMGYTDMLYSELTTRPREGTTGTRIGVRADDLSVQRRTSASPGRLR